MSTALVPIADGRFFTNETSLELASDFSEDEWTRLGETLGNAHRASAWWIGDWINYGDSRWGETFTEAQRITGFSYGYLNQCASVARRFAFGDRSPNLSWKHHYKAKALSNAEEVLVLAEAQGWSVRELQKNTASSPPAAKRVMPGRRHSAFIASARELARLGDGWNAEMATSLTPPEARKQLTVLNKAAERLAEVIAAVEYRAAVPHQFMGR